MKTSLSIPSIKLRQFQELVKVHDLRFVRNPLISGDSAFIKVDASHLTQEAANSFWSTWDRLKISIRETHAPRWKRLLRSMGVRV